MSEMEVEMGMMVDRARGVPAQADEHAHTPLSSGRGGRVVMVERMERVLTPSPPPALARESSRTLRAALGGCQARHDLVRYGVERTAAWREAPRPRSRERVGCLAVLGVYQRTPSFVREARGARGSREEGAQRM